MLFVLTFNIEDYFLEAFLLLIVVTNADNLELAFFTSSWIGIAGIVFEIVENTVNSFN